MTYKKIRNKRKDIFSNNISIREIRDIHLEIIKDYENRLQYCLGFRDYEDARIVIDKLELIHRIWMEIWKRVM